MAVHFGCVHRNVDDEMSASEVYIQAQVESALIEVNNDQTLTGEIRDTATRLILALNDRGIELRAR